MQRHGGLFLKTITVSDLAEQFRLEIIAGAPGVNTTIESEDIHRPGLEFTGYLDYFPKERIQILGRQEITYLHSLTAQQRDQRIGAVVAMKPPCFVITHGQEGLDYFTLHCNRHSIPLLRTGQKSTNFISRLNNFLQLVLAEEQSLHAVCMNIFGVGIILRGASGIGKSEVALALIERGHRLVSDDIVIIKKIGPQSIIGTHNVNNRELLQLRGIGFIDVTRLYGSGAYQEETSINLDIFLTPWDDYANTELLGIEDKVIEYLGVPVPQIYIPVRPGRDIAALIEVACKNWRLKSQGYDALEVFEKRILESQGK